MGGFFGAASHNDCINDVFFGTDYHSHLGTRRGGMTAYSPEFGFQRSIHSIENSPFRTKFEKDIETMHGGLCIGCISDSDPQPILLYVQSLDSMLSAMSELLTMPNSSRMRYSATALKALRL